MRRPRATANALARFGEISRRLEGRRVSLFLDYDGTLTPIVARPDLAVLDDTMRATLRRLAGLCRVAIISGRDLDDVRERVGLKGLVYAGSHGFDIAGPENLRIRHKEAAPFPALLAKAGRRLTAALEAVKGVIIEPKRYALAVHYRQVADKDLRRIETAFEEVLAAEPELRRTAGKKVFELRPRVDWDKGRALRWLMAALGEDGADALPFYCGDDETDEDAFAALSGRGITIFVGPAGAPSGAGYQLRDPGEVGHFLARLAQLLEERAGNAASRG